MKRKTHIFLGLAILLLLGSGAAVRCETEGERLQRERRATESEIAGAEASLRRIEAELTRLRTASRSNQTRLAAAELELKKAVEELRLQQARVTTARRDVNRLTVDIRVTGESIEKSRKHLGRRARALMNLSRLERLEFLLKSGDAAEMELRGRLLTIVANADVRLIRSTIEQKNRLESLKVEKQKVLNTLVEEERRLAAARNNVSTRRAELQRVQSELARQTATQEESKRKTQQMLAGIRSQLAAIRDRLAAISSRRVAPTRFSAPNQGETFRPIGVTLPGVYIRAAHGSPVKVMAEGEVVSVQSMHGMGQTVIVGHGGNLTSVYANLSSVAVAPGQSVSRGGSLGRSGTSPYGDAIYFAVYRSGVAQDPTNYIR